MRRQRRVLSTSIGYITVCEKPPANDPEANRSAKQISLLLLPRIILLAYKQF